MSRDRPNPVGQEAGREERTNRGARSLEIFLNTCPSESAVACASATSVDAPRYGDSPPQEVLTQARRSSRPVTHDLVRRRPPARPRRGTLARR
jgi:hypothetical protein